MTATPARTTGSVRRAGTASFVTVPGPAFGIVPAREVRVLSSHFLRTVCLASYGDDFKILLPLAEGLSV